MRYNINKKGGAKLKTIRIRLKELLEENNMTQKEFAEKYGYREASVSELARGYTKRFPKEVLENIINEFGIKDASELFEILEIKK